MDVADLVSLSGRLWGVEVAGWGAIVESETATVRLPAAGAVLHVSRAGLGDARVVGLQAARASLQRHGIPVVELLPSLTGRTWERVGDRVAEVERWVTHDGRMNTWSRLCRGAALLARVHDSWADLDLGPDAEACGWANWISPAEVVTGAQRATDRLTGWGLAELADGVNRLAQLTAADAGLPTQVVHGDFWDNNVYVRGEQLVAVTDFDFLGRRPRIDDLALLLYFADEQPYFEGSGDRDAETRMAELAPLVRAYADQLAVPLTRAEEEALPYALARQPLWQYGKRLPDDPDPDHAQRDALHTAAAVTRALEIVAEPDRWAEAFAST